MSIVGIGKIGKGRFATMSAKVLLITSIPVLVLFLLTFLVLIPALEHGFIDARKEYLKHLTDTAYGIFEGQEALVRSGAITRPEAQKRAVDLVKKIRFGETGYFFVFTRDLHIVTVPIRPEMEGSLVDQFKDGSGWGASPAVVFSTLCSPNRAGRGSFQK